MSSVNEIYDRINLQHIREFIHHGGTEAEISGFSYEERINIGEHSIIDRLKAVYPDKTVYNQVENELRTAFYTYEDVYMEIGMKVGARLVLELLKGDSFGGGL